MTYSMTQPLSMVPAVPGTRVACAGQNGWLIYPIIGWAVVEEVTTDSEDDLVDVGPGWRRTQVEPVVLEPSVGPTVGEPPHARRWLEPGDENPSQAECEQEWAEITERWRRKREQEAERERDAADQKARREQFRADARARLASSPPAVGPGVATSPHAKGDVRPPLGPQGQDSAA